MIRITRKAYSGYCQFRGALPDYVVAQIDKETSQFVEGYQYSEKFQTKREDGSRMWDGKFHLFRPSGDDGYYFPIGLLSIVETILSINDVGFEFNDVATDDDYPRMGFKWTAPFTLREYQKDVLLRLVQRGGTGLISLPTGAGKTVIGAFYAKTRDARTMVIVHRKELLYQWVGEIESMLGITPSIVGDGQLDFSGKVVIAMVQTLHSKMKSQAILHAAQKFKLVIFDECHTLPADTAFSVAMKLRPIWRLGLSATPRREDNTELKIYGATGNVVANVGVAELVDMGYIVKPVFRFLRQDDFPDCGGSKVGWATIYRNGIVANYGRNELIINEAFNLLNEGRQVYIHVDQIVHGKYLAHRIPNCKFVSGSTGAERPELIADFASGKIRCLVSTLLKEGVNIPKIDAIIYASGKKSGTATIQTIGRALRIAPGKEDAIIVDFVDWGHHILSSHSQQRRATYRAVYGKYCQ